MWMALVEDDDDGCLWDDPVIGESRDEVVMLAKLSFANIPEGYSINLYRCDFKEELNWDEKTPITDD